MTEIERQLVLLVKHNVEFVIIGGVAATLYGSSYLTHDLDVCYARDGANLKRLADALLSVNARLRGAPEDIPFRVDAETLRKGLNFTFTTDVGPLDLLGEVAGVGGYSEAKTDAVIYEVLGSKCAVLSLDRLIASKRAAGRTKDLLAIPELEAIRECTKPDETS
jgi:hypothetical protein